MRNHILVWILDQEPEWGLLNAANQRHQATQFRHMVNIPAGHTEIVPCFSYCRLEGIQLHTAGSHDSCRNLWTCRKTKRIGWHSGTFVCVCVYRWQFAYLCMFLRLCPLKLLQAKWFCEADMEQAHFCHPVALFSHFGQHSNHLRLSEQRTKDKSCMILLKRIVRDWHTA